MLHRLTRILIVFMLTIPAVHGTHGSSRIWSDSIEWKGIRQMMPTPDMRYNILHFEGAVNHDEWGLLPAYLYRVEVEDGIEYLNIELEEVSASVFSDHDITLIEDTEWIGEDFKTHFFASTARGIRYLNVYILPVRKNGEGDLMLLEKFNLTMEEAAVTPGGAGRSSGYKDHSVLRSGRWYKVAVRETGIHRITYDELAAMGMDVENIDPRNIRIFGNGNGMLPEPNSMDRPDDLLENALRVNGEEDGSFDSGDEVIFYAKGPVKLSYSYFYGLFSHELNLYTDTTYYFITADNGPGLRVLEAGLPAGDPADTISVYNVCRYHEKDEVNLIKSGKEWYGEVFNTQLAYDFDFEIPDIDRNYPVRLKVNFATRSTQTSHVLIYAEGELMSNEEMAGIPISSPVYGRSRVTNTMEFMAEDQTVNIRMEYQKSTNTSSAWLNYIEINAMGTMIFEGGQKNFRYAPAAGSGENALYRFISPSEPYMVWDVTRQGEILYLPFEAWENGYSFTALQDTLREFVVFDGTQYHSVDFLGEVENQDLHALGPYEFIIISYPDFLTEAERLAQHHREHDGLSVYVTTPEKVYNEFASGAPDPTAIRDFMRMLYLKAAENDRPRYLLLFGDGSYDYKDRIPSNHNLIPTFQSRESLKYPSSYVTDDYFGCFDLSEGSNAAGDLDIGIGRFPVVTGEQARQAVDKVIHYAIASKETMGQWRNRISFVADDEDGNIHLKQAEELCYIVDTSDASFNIQKIYFDAYPQVKTTGGDRYPDVAAAIDRAVEEGVLIMNYTGHGGELGWGHEKVLEMSTINKWTNYGNLPVFVTATCEFSRFDDPSLTSAGELVFLNSRGGGIALYTTTRLAYSQSNFGLNKKFYQHAFTYDEARQEYVRLGDMIRNAKTPSNSNIKNFVLLGDPALMIAYPQKEIITTEIVNEVTQEEVDTLKSLSRVTVRGQILDRDLAPVEDMNGLIFPVIYDKKVSYSTLGNDGSSKLTDFELRDRIIFSGKATVSDGDFEFSFVVPKDISYNVGEGKISYYAYDTVNFRDYHGYDFFKLGGIEPEPFEDKKGPDIELYLNNLEFVSGDYTTRAPILLAFLSDVSGINTIGNGIGHDIIAVINGDHQNPIVLNEYFQSDLDTYQSGSIIYPLGNLPDGDHSLTLKAWDVFNNSSEATINFRIDGNAPTLLTGVLNYPNPFRDRTRFEFWHNKPGEDLEVRIDIYDLNGRRVRSLEHSFSTDHLSAEPLYWDGRTETGEWLPSGVYIYSIIVDSPQVSPVRQTNKLMIIR